MQVKRRLPARPRLLIPALLGAATAGCGALVWLTPAASPERVLGALLLGLVLPGSALSRLLSWEESNRAVGRLLLVPALSLAVVIVDSLILYVVGIHLDAHSWTVSVGGVTLVASMIGPLRAIPLRGLQHPRPQTVRLLSLTGVGAAILLAAAVLVTIKGVRAQARADHFTQLWILPAAGGQRSATVGVMNHEGARKSYQVDVFVDHRLRSLSIVALNVGGQWTTRLRFGSAAKRVRVTLSLGGSPGVVYREVHLRLAPPAGSVLPTSTPATPAPSASNSLP